MRAPHTARLVCMLTASLSVMACTSAKDMKRGTNDSDGSVTDSGGFNVDGSTRDLGVDAEITHDASVIVDAGMDSQPIDLGMDFGTPDAGAVDARVSCSGPTTAGGIVAFGSSVVVVSSLVARVNTDSFDDLVVVTSTGDLIVYLGSATLPLSASTAVHSSLMNGRSAQQISVAAGDLNGDGNPDIVFGNADSHVLSVALQDAGTASFGSAHPIDVLAPDAGAPLDGGTTFITGSIAIGDFDHSGALDIAVGDNQLQNCLYSGLTTCTDNGGYLAILLNSGDNTGIHYAVHQSQPDHYYSACPSSVTAFFVQPTDLLSADFNHDGFDDLAWREASVAGNQSRNTAPGIGLSDGAGGFVSVGGSCRDYGGSQRISKLWLGDWDGDGNNDLISAGIAYPVASVFGYQSHEVTPFVAIPGASGTAPISLFSNAPAEYALAPPPLHPMNSERSWSASSGDFNCDGRLDVAFTRTFGAVDDAGVTNYFIDLFEQQAEGVALAGPIEVGVSGHTSAQTLRGDFNGDGRDDLVAIVGAFARADGFLLFLNQP